MAIALSCVVSAIGCGGSSSETPPPLEPSPQALATPPVRHREPGQNPSNEDDTPTFGAPRAPGTWGTTRIHGDAGLR